MTDAVAISIISAVASLGACVLGVINNIITTRAAVHTAENKITLEQLEKNTNSMTTNLVQVTGQSEYAKGLLRGKDIMYCDRCPLPECPIKSGEPCPFVEVK